MLRNVYVIVFSVKNKKKLNIETKFDIDIKIFFQLAFSQILYSKMSFFYK